MATDLERWAARRTYEHDEAGEHSGACYETALRDILPIIEAARRVEMHREALRRLRDEQAVAPIDRTVALSRAEQDIEENLKSALDALAAALRDAGVPGVDK